MRKAASEYNICKIFPESCIIYFKRIDKNAKKDLKDAEKNR